MVHTIHRKVRKWVVTHRLIHILFLLDQYIDKLLVKGLYTVYEQLFSTSYAQPVDELSFFVYIYEKNTHFSVDN